MAMKINEIAHMPTVIDNTHESVYRSYQLLQKVKELLADGTPNGVILEMIELAEAGGTQVEAARTVNTVDTRVRTPIEASEAIGSMVRDMLLAKIDRTIQRLSDNLDATWNVDPEEQILLFCVLRAAIVWRHDQPFRLGNVTELLDAVSNYEAAVYEVKD